MECFECRKPRVIYSDHVLGERQKLTLIMYLSEIDYTCGSEILPYNHALYSKVRVRDNLMCNQEIEFPYYSAEVGRKDLCAYCAMEGIQDVNLKNFYKVVLPLCISCMAAGKKQSQGCHYLSHGHVVLKLS